MAIAGAMLSRLAPLFGPLFGLGLLAACTTTAIPIEAPPAVPPAPPPPPGMELLLQKPAETAVALLGQPRLDKQEGIARQLQFAGDCILDLWYYPTAKGPVATYADARLADGRDLPAGQCLRLLRPDIATDPPATGP